MYNDPISYISKRRGQKHPTLGIQSWDHRDVAQPIDAYAAIELPLFGPLPLAIFLLDELFEHILMQQVWQLPHIEVCPVRIDLTSFEENGR